MVKRYRCLAVAVRTIRMYLAESQAAFIKQGWQVGKACHAYAPQQILLLQMRRGECAVFAVRQIDVFSDFLFRIVYVTVWYQSQFRQQRDGSSDLTFQSGESIGTKMQNRG